jgi:hypothetical protein
MNHRTEYVALLQEQHSQFLESINKAVSEDTAWDPQKCAIVPGEEPHLKRDAFKNKTDFVIQVSAVCEYGTGFTSLPCSKQDLASLEDMKHIPEMFVRSFQRLKERRAQEVSDEEPNQYRNGPRRFIESLPSPQVKAQ